MCALSCLCVCLYCGFEHFLFFKLIYLFYTSQYCVGFVIHQHASATGVHVFPILNPPPTSLPIPSLWVIPVHQPQASCILHQTWTDDSFLIWYYTCFNAILPNHPPPTPHSPKDCSIHLCLFCCLAYYSAIKKNTIESVLMRWMKLEPIIQSEVSQKEKHQYSILTHIYGI